MEANVGMTLVQFQLRIPGIATLLKFKFRGRPIQHRVWSAITTVEATGLRVHKNFFGGLHGWESPRILNYREALSSTLSHP